MDGSTYAGVYKASTAARGQVVQRDSPSGAQESSHGLLMVVPGGIV